MNKNRIIQELSLTPMGNKGWMTAPTLECGECHKTGKFAILFTNNGGLCHCFKCEYKTSLYNYLNAINRSDLIEGYSAPINDDIKSLDVEKEESPEQQEVKLPTGFKRIYLDDYLDDRGFTEYQYNLFKVGISSDIRLQNHIVFPLYQNGELISWLARSRKSKEWHKQNIKDYKSGKGRLVLRYYNADGTLFENILGGYDEITEDTYTVILVEGLTDKANVDRQMDLYSKDNVKCCFTFGKNLSKNQIKLLLKKGVRNIVLMYDPDALKEIEKFSLNYINKFDSIKCAKLEGEKDPGDLNKEEVNHILNTLYTPIDFYFNNIKKLD